MYYSKSAALREHVNTLAAVLIQYKSKNLSDLEYTRKISCMVTEAYRLRRRNNGKPFVPATVAEWMNMYLNGPNVCKYYKKEPNQIYVPIKINTGYRDAITTLTMVLETIMGTNTASDYFTDANADPSKKTTTRNKNSQLFDMLTHTKFSERLDIKTAFAIDKFEDLKNYITVFDKVLPEVKKLDSGTAVSIEKQDSDPGDANARTTNMTFTKAGGASSLAVKYTPVFKLDSANNCNIIKIDKKANTTINLQPFLIGGAGANTYYVMNSAIYKDDKDRLHTLQMVYITDTSEFFYMQDGKTFLANKDLNKLKIVEGYFCYDKISDLTDAMIIADQTANKTLEFLLLGQIDKNSTDVATLANFDPAKNAEEIAKYAGMGDRVSEPIGTGISDESAASRGLAYFNRLMKDGTLPIIKEKITKARDARQKYIDYLTIALTLAFVIAEQGVNMGLVRTSSIAEAVVPRLIVSAVTIGGLLATKAFATFQNNEYAKNLLENL